MHGFVEPADTAGVGRHRSREIEHRRGVVSGGVLRAIRVELGLTQRDLADALEGSEIVVRSRESGRRPASKMKVADLHRDRRVLVSLGADPHKVALMDMAIEVDLLWDEITREGTPAGPHPLSTVVPNRTMTELLAWPLSGLPPQRCRTDRAVPPLLRPGERELLATRLRHVTEHAAHDEAGSMLVRQACYLLAHHPGSQGWLREFTTRERRTSADLDHWTPHWPVSRSHAVSQAIQGDPEPLRQFITEGLASDLNITANLNYWAYWTGELSDLPWRTDQEMITTDPQAWSGLRLIDSLIDNLSDSPYRDLCAHTLWALLQAKPHLIHNTDRRTRLLTRIEESLSTPTGLVASSRDRLAQVAYLARSSA